MGWCVGWCLVGVLTLLYLCLGQKLWRNGQAQMAFNGRVQGDSCTSFTTCQLLLQRRLPAKAALKKC